MGNDPLGSVDPLGLTAEEGQQEPKPIGIITGDTETGDLGTNPYANAPVIDPTSLVAAAAGGAAECSAKTYQTYTKTNWLTGQVYSGRTSGTGTPLQNIARRDGNHHMNLDGYAPAVLDQSSANSSAIRGREQQLIDANGGAQSMGGTSGNSINGISPSNSNRDHYLNQATQEFGN